MRTILPALAAVATIAVAMLATPAEADGERGERRPAVVGGIVAGVIVSNQLPRPNFPGPVVYEYAQPGPVTYDYYALPPQYLPPVPLEPCWNSPGSFRFRA